MMWVYTINFLYRGGNYTSQVNGGSVKEALINWSDVFEVDIIRTDRINLVRLIQRVINEESGIIKNTGLINVWHLLINIDDEKGILNIVKTECH